MKTVERLLTIAFDEVGYREKPVNRNKYGRHFGMDGTQWCGWFVMWVFEMANIPMHNTAYTPVGAEGFKKKGLWHTKGKVKPGDVVYFDFPNDNLDRISHVGIAVKQLPNGNVLTIEGNTSGSGDQRNGGEVMIKERPKRFIVGWGRPKYQKAPKPIVKVIVKAYNKSKVKVTRLFRGR